ncbi:MAG: glycoside hydrolase family 27 protein [Bacteroidia bacterium]|nr:glycoside hydrolase family 27 protein [Bacteroidia bacterium]
MVIVRRYLALIAFLFMFQEVYSTKPVNNFTPNPPMGWNSWDCFGMEVNEIQVKAVADYMAQHLKQYGWEYVVIDAGWYHPVSLKTENSKRIRPVQNMDQYGRLIPDTVKFPSAKSGVGFKALADYIHIKGLKFGIHVQRGIPWNAVANNTPIKGSVYFARDIVNRNDSCRWSPIMKGLNLSSEGAQSYLNAVFELYSQWGVDFVKVDDMTYPAQKTMTEAVRKAIDLSGRSIVFSLSGGEAPVAEQNHLVENVNLWRVSGDLWDGWKYLKKQFDLLHNWQSFDVPGSWPDADMIPIGRLRKTGCDDWVASLFGKKPSEVTDEYSRLTDIEKQTLMTLWSIFKSPLFLGGYLPENDAFTTRLITNAEVLAVNQKAENRHEIRNENGFVVWTSKAFESAANYIALFNLNDGKPQIISVSWKELGLKGKLNVRDVWKKTDLGKHVNNFSAVIEPHGSLLIRIGK